MQIENLQFCSFPGSAWERHAVQALPVADNLLRLSVANRGRASTVVRSEAEPRNENNMQFAMRSLFCLSSNRGIDVRSHGVTASLSWGRAGFSTRRQVDAASCRIAATLGHRMLTAQVGNLTGPGDAGSVAHVADAASIGVFWGR